MIKKEEEKRNIKHIKSNNYYYDKNVFLVHTNNEKY